MEHKEVFFLFLLCVMIVGGLVGFALIKGVDGTVFGTGVGGICAIAGFSVKTLIGDKRGKQGERGTKGDKGDKGDKGSRGEQGEQGEQ